MKYLKKFQTEEQYTSFAISSQFVQPNLSTIVSGESGSVEVRYNEDRPSPYPHDYSQDYLTFNIISGGTIRWVASHYRATKKTISYKRRNNNHYYLCLRRV